MSTIRVDKVKAATDDTDLTLQGSGTGTVTFGAGTSLINANVTGNLSVSRSLAVGYTDGRVPQANLEVKGNVYIDGNTHIRDQQIFSFGTGKDLKIYHDGGNSYINDTGTGSLSIKGSATIITNTGGQNIIAQQGDGAVLYYAGMTKLETVPSGIIMRYGLGANVEGNVSVSRSLAVGYTDGRVPQANLEVKGNTHITGLTTFASTIKILGGSPGADKVLTSDADGDASWADAAGGAFTSVVSGTTSNGIIEITDVDLYGFQIQCLVNSADLGIGGAWLKVYFSTDNGSTWLTATNYRYVARSIDTEGTADSTYTSTGEAFAILGLTGGSSVITVCSMPDASQRSFVSSVSGKSAVADGDAAIWLNYGDYDVTEAHNAIKLDWQAVTVDISYVVYKNA